MAFHLEFAADAERDFGLIFDHLLRLRARRFAAGIGAAALRHLFGETPDTTL